MLQMRTQFLMFSERFETASVMFKMFKVHINNISVLEFENVIKGQFCNIERMFEKTSRKRYF